MLSIYCKHKLEFMHQLYFKGTIYIGESALQNSHLSDQATDLYK